MKPVPGWLARLASAMSAGLLSLASMVVVFLAVTGQPGRLVGWVQGSLSVASGYGAMALEQSTKQEYLYAALMVLGLVVLCAVALRRDLAEAGIVVLLAAVAYLKFREGFERHDAGHTLLFFSAFALLPWLLVRPGARALVVGGAAVLSAGAIVFSLNLGARAPRDLFQLYDGPRQALTQFHELSSGAQTAQIQLAAKAAARAELGVPENVLAAVRGRPADITPWDTVAVWAYGLRWKPIDVWATYSSYTPTLDHADALSVSRSYGPDVVLRRAALNGIDGRYSGFDSPEFQRTLVCSFRRLAAGGGWEALVRSPNRCGTPRLLTSVRVVPGQGVQVPVPAASEALLVRVTLHKTLLEKLRSLLFKPSRDCYIDLDGMRFRFVEATGPDGLLLVSPPTLLTAGGSGLASVRRVALLGPFTSADLAFSEVPVLPVPR